MPTDHQSAKRYLERLKALRSLDDMTEAMLPSEEELLPRLKKAAVTDVYTVDRRWQRLNASAEVRSTLLDQHAIDEMKTYGGNIENYIGVARVPMGVAGPLRVNGLHANGDYYVPMATTEAALVASTTRGAQVISLSGGCQAAVINQGVQRAPVFCFENLLQAGQFVMWLSEQYEVFEALAKSTTRHGQLKDMRISIEGNHVYVIYEYNTAEAAGQNMVTFATKAICDFIVEKTPVMIQHWFLESNMSGDKKATAQVLQTARGRKVVADVTVPAKLVKRRLHCTVEDMTRYWACSAVGGVLSGSVGIQGHYANGLAAIYLACGQDVACVSESSIGVTRMEETSAGDLYVSVTLPNIIVGSVGGGTGLPTASAAIELLGLPSDDKATALAEVISGTLLAGEISIIGALAAHEFSSAHEQLARGRSVSS